MEGSPPEEKNRKKGDEELKREISCHPMFSLLKEAHLSCLKVCSGGEEEANLPPGRAQRSAAAVPEGLSELDIFMEAYYVALVELSLAIQKPLQEAAAFAGCICYLLDDISADAPGSSTATPAE